MTNRRVKRCRTQIQTRRLRYICRTRSFFFNLLCSFGGRRGRSLHHLPQPPHHLVTFSGFKDEMLVSPLMNGTVRDFVCTFFWKLIKKLQDVHSFGYCLESITAINIEVIGIEPQFLSRKIAYTDKLATKNYKSIHALLTDLFENEDEVPYSMTEFMKLLLGDPVKDSYLIARHVAILPRSLRVLLIENIMVVPGSLPFGMREKYYKIIDSVLVDSNWEINFDTSNKKFLSDIFNFGVNKRKGCVYETSCPSVRTYWLLRFFRNCIEHAGIPQRTSLVDTPEYKAWKLTAGKLADFVKKDSSSKVRDPDITLSEVLDVLERSFPTILPELQRRLNDGDLLQYLCINPLDEYVHSDSQVSDSLQSSSGSHQPPHRQLMSFKTFKNTLATDVPFHESNKVRIFVWSLVLQIQGLHKKDLCITTLNGDAIQVCGNEAFLLSETEEISEYKVNETYKALHCFLKAEFFTELILPPSIEGFLNLLVAENVRYNEPLIVRHYAILPDMSRVAFINNLVRLPSTWGHERRVLFFDAVDSLNQDISANWSSIFNNEDPNQEDNVLRSLFQKKQDSSYHTCPVTKSYTLLNFHRNSCIHVGDKDRLPITKTGAAYMAWLRSLHPDLEKICRKKIETFVMDKTKVKELKDRTAHITQHDVSKILLHKYPTFLTSLQSSLHRAGLLRYFCIHPYEDTLES